MFRRNTKTTGRNRQGHRSVPERRNVFSYHAARVPEPANVERRADPFAPAKPSRVPWWKQLPMVLATLVIAASAVDLLLLNTNPRVVSLATSSNQFFLRPLDSYQDAAQHLLSRSILNRNKLTVNAGGVSSALKTEFPELADVSITLPLVGHRPVVYIEPDTPALVLVSSAGGSFIVARSGRALISTNDVASVKGLNLPIVNDETGLAVQLGKAALAASNVSFIGLVVAQLNIQHISYTGLTLPSGGSELDVRLSGQGIIVKFNLQGEVEQQVGQFIATRNYLTGQNIAPTQYIDARVPGRTYYK